MAKPRRTPRLAIGGVIILVLGYVAAALMGIVPDLDWYRDRQFTREIAGCPTRLGSAERAFDTPRSFNGDGFSIARFNLPRAFAACIDRSASELAAYPQRLGDRADWEVVTWRQAPLSARDSAMFEWALRDDDPVLAAELRAALARPTTWYAMRFKADADSPGHVMNVDLYVVDRVTGKLFLLNQNT